MAQSLPADLQRAGPLSDPVRAASGLIVLGTAAGLVGAVAVRVSVDAPLSLADGLFMLSGIVTPLAMWLLVAPGRREPVLYLRAFRSDYDVNAGEVRRLLSASLGQRLRLCGIRAPQERVSWFSRLLLSTVTSFRYLGTEQFELEASDYNWMPRLLASFARARLVIIDIRDLTAHVADEIRLSHLAMDSERCIFLTDSTRPEAAWRTFISALVDTPDSRVQHKLLRYEGAASEFVRRANQLIADVPPPDGTIRSAALEFVRSRVPAQNWSTSMMERHWAQALGAIVIVNVALWLSYGTWAMVLMSFILSLVAYAFYFGALFRAFGAAKHQATYRWIVGGPHPLWRPTVILGLTLAGLGLAIAIPVVIAVPGLRAARVSGNEASAIGSVRLINSAQAVYAATCGNGGFASRLTVLGTPPEPGGQSFIFEPLGTSDAPQRTGYQIALRAARGSSQGPTDCRGRPTVTDYYAAAVPVSFGSTGSRSFGTTSEGMIWEVSAAAAPEEPFGPPAIPLQ